MSDEPKKKKSGKSMPVRPWHRASKLLQTGASLGFKEIAGRISERVGGVDQNKQIQRRLSQAEKLVGTLGDLKGAAMKAGQLLAIEASDLLPPEVTAVLRQLHDDAPALTESEIRSILRTELGDKADAIKNLTPEPVAAASIGQVHRGEIEGQSVALKIQYPGVANSIDSDLKVVRKITETFFQLQTREIELDPLFEELTEVLHQEVDYRQEMQRVLEYRGAIADQPGFVVPEPLPEFCTQHVLCLSFEEGEKLGDWLKKDRQPEDVEWLADRVLDLIRFELFGVGLIQTDPNYGNFLLRHSTKELVLLDFGAAKAYPKDFRAKLKDLAAACIDVDEAGILSTAERMGVLSAKETPEAKVKFLDFALTAGEPFRPESQPFAFSDTDFLETIRDQAWDLVRTVRYSSPVRQLVLVNRKLGGMFHLLKEAGATYDLHEFWLKAQAMPIGELNSSASAQQASSDGDEPAKV